MKERRRPAQAARGKDLIIREEDHLDNTASPRPTSSVNAPVRGGWS